MCVSSCVWMCDLLVDSGKSECCHSGRKEERGVRGFWELVLRYIIFPLGQAGTGCELGGLAGGIWLQCTRIHIRTNLTISERNQDTNVNMILSSCPKCNNIIWSSAYSVRQTEFVVVQKDAWNLSLCCLWGGQSHKFYCPFSLNIQITDLFPHCLLSYRPLCLSNLSLRAFSNFFTKSAGQTIFHGMHDFFFFFFLVCVNFGKRGACCCRQGSSSHLSVQIACKLFNSHSVANKIGHSVLAFLPAGMVTDHRPNLTTMHDNHNKHSQQNFIRVNRACKIYGTHLSKGWSHIGAFV